MSDAPMPPTLETIASSLTELKKSIDEQFKRVDEQFKHVDEQFKHVDERFTEADQDRKELKSQLLVRVEAVEAKVDLVYDEVIGTRKEVRAIRSEHATFTQLVDNHEVRIRALESKKPAKR
jgi:hypothetical protein